MRRGHRLSGLWDIESLVQSVANNTIDSSEKDNGESYAEVNTIICIQLMTSLLSLIILKLIRSSDTYLLSNRAHTLREGIIWINPTRIQLEGHEFMGTQIGILRQKTKPMAMNIRWIWKALKLSNLSKNNMMHKRLIVHRRYKQLKYIKMKF